jgi:ankyrin repeat protein
MLPLMEACTRGDIQTVEFLLNKGANPNVSFMMKRTALHYVAFLGDKIKLEDKLKIIELLISHNANTNALDYEERTPLHLAVMDGNSCKDNNLSMVMLLIINGSCKTAMDNRDKTPLSYAIEWTNLELVKLLTSYGIRPENKQKYITENISRNSNKSKILQEIHMLINNADEIIV